MKLLSVFFIFCVFSVAVASETQEEIIKDIFSRTGKENLLLNKTSMGIVESHIDFGEMCKDILATEAKKRSAEELRWFETTIKEIITRTVYPEAPKFLENVNLTFKTTQASDNKAKIISYVKKKGEATEVEYVFKKIGEDWKIVDVAIDEESWVKTINEKVHKTIIEKGWKGLTDRLNKRLRELKTQNTR
jgi:ABC-type transporter MlaC component